MDAPRGAECLGPADAVTSVTAEEFLPPILSPEC